MCDVHAIPFFFFLLGFGRGGFYFLNGRAPCKQQAAKNCSITCRIKNGPSSRAMAEAGFGFQMAGGHSKAGRQIYAECRGPWATAGAPHDRTPCVFTSSGHFAQMSPMW
jgi:hypothetical protein